MKMMVKYIKNGNVNVWSKYVPSYFYGCLDFNKEVGNVQVISEEWV